jgi:long-chain acyl-CoA synthetase
MHIDEVVELGVKNETAFPCTKPNPDSMAVIMYTSGSTGKPKGVLIRHSSMLAMVAGVVEV